MELLKQGAEAKLFKSTYLGRESVVKVREKKKYREAVLDERILKERIRTECGLLSRAKNSLELCKEAGKIIGKMHSQNLIHGDLTTSNILLHNKVLVFLDFGLGGVSSKIEDKAVDVLVFKKTFMATHYKLEKGWSTVEKAYSKAFSQGSKVLEHLKEVEARARYF